MFLEAVANTLRKSLSHLIKRHRKFFSLQSHVQEEFRCRSDLPLEIHIRHDHVQTLLHKPVGHITFAIPVPLEHLKPQINHLQLIFFRRMHQTMQTGVEKYYVLLDCLVLVIQIVNGKVFIDSVEGLELGPGRGLFLH